MINAAHIRQLVEKKFHESESPENQNFLVDVSVSALNKIKVTIDNINGLAINECVNMSRFIENQLDREAEDFELEVSSPGLDQPFKVLRQYEKNIGREIEIILTDGQKTEGKLIRANEKEIEIEQNTREKKENGRKQFISRKLIFPFDKIKETRIVIKF